MKILIMTDSPFIPTGQARVGREIAVGLGARGHEVGYIGWFHNRDVFPNLPHNIQFWPCYDNQYGATMLDFVVERYRPEILLTVGDFWNIGYITNPNVCRTRKHFQWCSYIPVDGEPMNGGLPPSIINIVEEIDLPVAYTNYAKDAVLKSVKDQETKDRIDVIYHGVDTNIFKPDNPSDRRKKRQVHEMDDKFIFLCVCRNQSRKNIPALLHAWKKFISNPKYKDKCVLWLHTKFFDNMGWDVDDILDEQGLRDGSIAYYNDMAYANQDICGVPEAHLADLYKMSDAFVLLAGEGFGLPIFEAMATKVPCILINHSAAGELGADGRAHLINDVTTITWTGRYLTERPIPKIDAVVAAFEKIYNDKEYRDAIAEKGYEYAKKYTWDFIAQCWHNYFTFHEIPFLKPKKLEVVV